MKINLFAGARRIALVLAIFWVAGWTAAAFFNQPTPPSFTYLIETPTSTPQLVTRACHPGDARSYPKLAGNPDVILCFQSMAITDSDKRLIIYGKNGDELLGAYQDSTEVQAYASKYADHFQLPEEAAALVKQRRTEHWQNTLIPMATGLVIGWILVALTGWIMRGFMGIPRGMDMRPLSLCTY